MNLLSTYKARTSIRLLVSYPEAAWKFLQYLSGETSKDFKFLLNRLVNHRFIFVHGKWTMSVQKIQNSNILNPGERAHTSGMKGFYLHK